MFACALALLCVQDPCAIRISYTPRIFAANSLTYLRNEVDIPKEPLDPGPFIIKGG